VILEQRLNPDLRAELNEVLDLGSPFLDLRQDGLREIVFKVEHPKALDAESSGGAEDFFGVLLSADFIDSRRENGQLQVSFFECFRELWEFVCDLIGLHVPPGSHGGFDAIKTDTRSDVGDLIEAQSLKMFGEATELVFPRLSSDDGALGEESANGGGEEGAAVIHVRD
jgi:hypothetical protein